MQEALKAIVIGDDHYNTLNVIRALGENGILVFAVIVSSSAKSFVLKSKYIHKGFLIPEISREWLINQFNNLSPKIPILVTSDKIASFIDSNYDCLSKYFILPSVEDREGALIEEMDKDKQLVHAKAAGFHAPKSISISPSTFSKDDLINVDYPCLIKPEKSIIGSKKDFRICKNQNELISYLTLLSSHLDKVLVQEFIPNEEVILLAGVRTIKGKNYIFGEINKYKHSKKLENLGLNCVGMLTPTSSIANLCERYVTNINYHGCYSIEVIRKQSISRDSNHNFNYFLEINLRTDGLLFFYTAANINFPAIWVRSCYGEELSIKPSKKKIIGMNEFLYLRNSLSLEVFSDFFKTNVFSIFKLSDIKPFIYKLFYHG